VRAVAGAGTALGGLVGGTVAGAFGEAAGYAATAAFDFAAGAAGQAAGDAICGRAPGRDVIVGGAFNVVGGAIGNSASQMRGVTTLNQARYFVPRTIGGLAGPNGQRLTQSSFLSGGVGSWSQVVTGNSCK